MSDLAAAAAALGIPETLAQRSAEARAQETGSTVEEVLAAWAGGGPAPGVAAAVPTAVESADDPDPTGEPTPGVEAPEVTIEIPAAKVAMPAPASAGPVTRSAVPAEVTMAEAANIPVVVTVPTTGIMERTSFAVPRWLAFLFFLVPAVALFALGGAATGDCGSATELQTDVVTGAIVNCDGTPFEGSSVGGGTTDFIALGQSIYDGQALPAVNCASCHGAGGGGGVGPALNGVITTFGSCADQEEWVSLGSAGFKAAGMNTYGDSGKPVTQGMPGFSASLSAEQIAAVTSFERVRFGGGDPEAVLTDCGLVEAPPEEGQGTEGGTPGEGEAPAESGTGTETETTTTTAP
ncbi:MAG TPA: c-type cytochrome [Acidimicrobiia bacterium]